MRICVLVLSIFVAMLPMAGQEPAPQNPPQPSAPQKPPAGIDIFEPEPDAPQKPAQAGPAQNPPAASAPEKPPNKSPKTAAQDGASSKPADSPAVVQRGKTNSIQDIVGKTPEGEILSDTDLQALVEKWTTWTAWDKENVEGLQALATIKDFGAPLCHAKANLCTFKAGLYVIQIVGAEATVPPAEYKVALKSSAWYLYRPNSRHSALTRVVAGDGKFRDVLNARTGTLISLQLLKNPKCGMHLPKSGEEYDPSVFDCENDVSAKYEVTVTEKIAANVTALITLVNGVLGVGKSEMSASGAFNITLPQPPKYAARASVYELGKNTPPRPPFDWTITAKITGSNTGDGDCSNLTKSASCSFTRTVSVAAPQYWNVGIDVTPRGPRENKYALSNSNIVTQSHTIHSPLFAALDFSPWAQWGYRPYFQAGISLSGAAFHLPFVSVAEPLPFTKKWLQISLYGGVVFMQQTFPKTLAIGATSNTAAFNADLVTDRALKSLFGIEVPVSSIISKVKSSVGGGGGKGGGS
jgi:hypothetical protein